MSGGALAEPSAGMLVAPLKVGPRSQADDRGQRRMLGWHGRSAASRGWRQDDATLLYQFPSPLAGSVEELRRNL